MYTCQSQSPNSSLLCPPTRYPYVCSLHLCLYFLCFYFIMTICPGFVERWAWEAKEAFIMRREVAALPSYHVGIFKLARENMSILGEHPNFNTIYGSVVQLVVSPQWDSTSWFLVQETCLFFLLHYRNLRFGFIHFVLTFWFYIIWTFTLAICISYIALWVIFDFLSLVVSRSGKGPPSFTTFLPSPPERNTDHRAFSIIWWLQWQQW